MSIRWIGQNRHNRALKDKRSLMDFYPFLCIYHKYFRSLYCTASIYHWNKVSNSKLNCLKERMHHSSHRFDTSSLCRSVQCLYNCRMCSNSLAYTVDIYHLSRVYNSKLRNRPKQTRRNNHHLDMSNLIHFSHFPCRNHM